MSASVLSKGEYRLDQCEECGTYFQAEIGDSEFLEFLYTHWASEPGFESDPIYSFDVSNPMKSRDGHELMAVAAFLGLPISKLRVLDYGMGWAGWGRVAASLGADVHGFDLSEDRMQFARQHGIKTELGDGLHFINTEQVFEHVAEPVEVAGELSRLLRPGGVLKISAPSTHGVEALIGRLGKEKVGPEDMTPVAPLEHINCFTREGLYRLGRKFGLAPVKPTILQRFAFLRHKGSLAIGDPKRVAKEMIRPFYQYHNRANRYLWLQRT